eukprot:5018364-Amphidinium_carterae.1
MLVARAWMSILPGMKGSRFVQVRMSIPTCCLMGQNGCFLLRVGIHTRSRAYTNRCFHPHGVHAKISVCGNLSCAASSFAQNFPLGAEEFSGTNRRSGVSCGSGAAFILAAQLVN